MSNNSRSESCTDEVVIIVVESGSDKGEDQMVSEVPVSSSDMATVADYVSKEESGDVMVGGAVAGGIDNIMSGCTEHENNDTLSRARESDGESNNKVDKIEECESVVAVM